MGVLPVEFQVLELVGLVAVEDLDLVKEHPDLVVEVPGSELVVLAPEVEVLALVKADPDYVRDLAVAEADLVAKVDLDVARDVPELE
jgi:alpha-galactosidase